MASKLPSFPKPVNMYHFRTFQEVASVVLRASLMLVLFQTLKWREVGVAFNDIQSHTKFCHNCQSTG
jgi:hypothetical protein